MLSLRTGVFNVASAVFLHILTCGSFAKQTYFSFDRSTCYTDEMMAQIAYSATKLKLGAIIITFTKRVPGESFVILHQSIQPMSWGAATVFIHQKVTQPLPSCIVEESASALDKTPAD